MRKLLLTTFVLLISVNVVFAQIKERKQEYAVSIDTELLSSDFDPNNKFLFLGFKQTSNKLGEYMVVELSSCKPVIKIDRGVKNLWLKAQANYQVYGTIGGGPFYLANEALCRVEIFIQNKQQKLAWEERIHDVVYLGIISKK